MMVRSLAHSAMMTIAKSMILPTLALVVCNGCGSSHGTIGISGTVTYQGKPVVGEIQFSPEDASGEARAATGKLDDSGRYTLTSFETGDGAKPGKYLVSVISKGPDKPVPENKKRLMMEEDAKGNGDPLIPKKYFDPLSSGLTADVKSSGGNIMNFELKD